MKRVQQQMSLITPSIDAASKSEPSPVSVESKTAFVVGILNCSGFEGAGDMFASIYGKVDASLKFKTYQCTQSHFPSSVAECNGYLITGSPASVYDGKELDWVDKCNDFVERILNYVAAPGAHPGPRVIGVCYGHQVIGWVANGRKGVSKSAKGWGVGIKPCPIISGREEIWMQPPKPAPKLLYTHQDQVDTIPAHARHIGRSDHCQYEMIAVRQPKTLDWKAFSHQGHVEIPRHALEQLYEMRRDKIDGMTPGRTDTALASLAAENTSDELTVVQWDINFLRRTFG